MNKEVCKRFENVREWLPDKLIDGNYQFNDNNSLNNNCNSNDFSNNYCNNIEFSDFLCNIDFKSDFEKISAGCLYLLDEFIKDCGVDPPPARNNINIVDYIMIWLSYMLNLKESEKDNITCFYGTYVYYCDKYKEKINELTDYKSYMGLIDTKMDMLNMNSKILSKFYKAFKLLCEMYTEFDEKKKDCTKCLGKANEFVETYKELNDPDNTKYDGYCQAWSTLSNDYKNLKNECNDDKFLPEIDTTETDAKCSEETSKKNNVAGYEQFSEDTSSSSSIASKLIPVLLIFVAIPILLGIAYKYSLFGFRKRFQKQKLREKIKNVKKRMNH
ncbi:PIR protein [Plasmodium yoelii]|uniref:PIR protein n=2 Tax=Plasmodium yoelii TaxID=5861 RepID=A0AAE9WVT4_PLAYO|nr:PIR protein [Plasmodium yoelii]WBY61338.1 PIR protein [Plasmodium yoelii yoelii]CDS44690.1 YIR protein [Plasmodium yoelii]VTZ81992.1 PIR protein [Plasmodium yoelii]|eukprot:XP_022813087.1 PIR protein [Plasmodium yoelii]